MALVELIIPNESGLSIVCSCFSVCLRVCRCFLIKNCM